ncbi:MAG: tRNA pseudouridine(38-40) synthase TruA [Herpetosiphonaceae bacterium]|nr:tRNA pseudouridine(38-40) synthase TruA [Herpetosiphonaceae bacterium]
MRNIAVQLEYDGTHFVGSQYQAQGRTVQAEVEGAWQRLTGEDRRWTFAGRTDAGVHAQGQVANVCTTTTQTVATVQRALNALLPPDIAVRATWEVSAEFHARRSAVQRRYRYTILNQVAPSALQRYRWWHVWTPLDLGAMREAARYLVGEHDFGSFGVVDQGSTVRRCMLAHCLGQERDGYALVVIDLAANGFLRHMVRTITAILVDVGRGKLVPSDVRPLLERADRSLVQVMAPAHGLSLMAVQYGTAAALNI